MKKYRKVLAMLLSAGMILSIASSVAASDEVITINVLTGKNEAALAHWPTLIEKFEAENPNINIEVTYNPAGNDMMATLRTQIMAGTAPDIAETYKTYTNEFIDEGVLLNLKDYYAEYGLEEVQVGGARNWCADLDEATLDNPDPYGIPDQIVTSALYYNTIIFEELGLEEPTDLESLIDVSKKLKEAGYVTLIGSGGDDNFVDILAKVQCQFAGVDFLLALRNGEAKLTDEPMLKAMQVVETMMKEGVIDPACMTYTFEDAWESFGRGEAAMLSLHTYPDAMLRLIAEENENFDYNIAKGISFTDDPVGQYSASFGSIWTIPATCEHPDEAAKVLFYLWGEEACKAASEQVGMLTNVSTAGEYLASETMSQVVAPYHLPGLTMDSFYLLDMVPGTVLNAIASGMQGMMNGEMTAEEALAFAQEVYDAEIAG